MNECESGRRAARVPNRTETVKSYAIMMDDVIRALDIIGSGKRTVTVTRRGDTECLIITFQDIAGAMPGENGAQA